MVRRRPPHIITIELYPARWCPVGDYVQFDALSIILLKSLTWLHGSSRQRRSFLNSGHIIKPPDRANNSCIISLFLPPCLLFTEGFCWPLQQYFDFAIHQLTTESIGPILISTFHRPDGRSAETTSGPPCSRRSVRPILEEKRIKEAST